MLTIGDDYWIGGDEALLGSRRPGTRRPLATLVGKYAPITESDASELGSFTLRTHPHRLSSGCPTWPCSSRTPAPATVTEVDGRPAYLPAGKGGPRLWVAAYGSGTLLRVGGVEERSRLDLSFSEWDRAGTFIEPPPLEGHRELTGRLRWRL